MHRFGLLILGLIMVLPVSAGSQEKDAKKLAQEILDQGALMFDNRDATAMAATYTEDARIELITKDDSSGEYKIDVKQGRAEIEALYRDAFKDTEVKTTSRNSVEFARFVAPDMMIVDGEFQPNVAKPGKFPFVQLRVKKGAKWVMKHLQFFVISQD
jgi:hypothetical protein